MHFLDTSLPPKENCYKHEPKGKGGGVATILAIFSAFSEVVFPVYFIRSNGASYTVIQRNKCY